MHLLHPPSVESCSRQQRPLPPPRNVQNEAFSRDVRANGAALGLEPEAAANSGSLLLVAFPLPPSQGASAPASCCHWLQPCGSLTLVPNATFTGDLLRTLQQQRAETVPPPSTGSRQHSPTNVETKRFPAEDDFRLLFSLWCLQGPRRSLPALSVCLSLRFQVRQMILAV